MSIYDRSNPLTGNDYDYVNSRERNLLRNDDNPETSLHDVSWIGVTRFFLTILLRIGFLLVQIGSVPVTNINLILLQNIVDLSCVTIVYVLAGFVIAYNGDINGLIGEGGWIGDENTNKDEAIIGWQAVAIASAISTSCLVGRTHTVGYLFVGTIMAGLVQPFVIHWAWTTNGWMAQNDLNNRMVNFYDYGGSTIVHTVGSLTGYIGCTILGRRIIRLRDIDNASIPADSAGTAFAGYLLILIGLQSLCFPSATKDNPRKLEKGLSLIVVNNLLGASACSLVVVALHFILSHEPFNHWTVMRCIQASIAGITILSAGVNFYTPILCLGLGFSAGIIHYLVSRRVFQSALEDYCNIVATHLVCSLVGSFVAPFGHTSKDIDDYVLTMLLNVAWQVICLVAVVALVTVTMTLVFFLLECLGILRNRSEIVNHLRAIVAVERGPTRSYMQRLFLPDGETLYLQPCTAHVKRQGIRSNPRFFKYQSNTDKIQKPKPQETIQGIRKSVNSEFIVSPSSPKVVVVPTRIKKSRHVHTLRSTSEIAIIETEGHNEAMGDNQIAARDDENRESDEKISKDAKISKIECSGDFSTKYTRTEDDLLIEKFTVLDPAGNKNNLQDKNLKRRHEPYRLHRTQKCTNLRLEAINENDESVKFLLRPRAPSFSSTESDSDDENIHTIRNKYPRNFSSSVPNVLVRKTPECTDIRL